jgi:pimeloyl-ACP methyl ester carboxylesterase
MSTRPPTFLPPPPVAPFLEPLLLTKRYLVDAGAWRIHVQEQGRGTPIVLLHGNPTWGILWRKVVRALPPSVRCIVPDLFGLGLSDKPRHLEAHTIDAHAHAIRRVLDALELEQFILVVQDWGGPIGLAAVADRLPQLRGLVVLNTVLAPPREGFRSTAFHRFAHTPILSDLAFRGALFPIPILQTAQGDRSSLGAAERKAYRWPLRTLRDRMAPLALARMVPNSPHHPSIPALERVAATVAQWHGPTEIVWGTRDPVLGRALGRVRRALPHASVTETDGGHFLQEEVPDTIAQSILSVVEASEPSR